MIERMSLLNIISKKEDINSVFRKILVSDDFHQVEATIGVSAADAENENIPEDFFDNTKKFDLDKRTVDYYYKAILKVMDELEINDEIDVSVVDLDDSLNEVYANIDSVNKELFELLNQRDELLLERKKLDRIGSVDEFKGLDFDIKKLRELDNFEVYIGAFGINEDKRMHMNYENMQIVILPLGRNKFERIYIVITPIEIKGEAEALLRSLSFMPIDVDWDMFGTSEETAENFRVLNRENKLSLIEVDLRISDFVDKYKSDINMMYSRLKLEYDLISIKEKCAYTDYYFWYSAYVPREHIDSIKEDFDYEDAKLIFIDVEDKELDREKFTIPTRLKNKKFFRPFEMLVNMYGVPSYYEKDPTGFVAICYMLLFGAMFGDVGQGLLIFLSGLFIVKRNKSSGKNTGAGALLYSIGASSMIFGFVYDSFFGIEHFISHLLKTLIGTRAESIFVRPIDNTSIILISAIVLGVLLLLSSFVLSMINKINAKNYKEGIFGKNGFNGMIMFLAFIFAVVSVILDMGSLFTRIMLTVIVLTAVVLIFREPFANMLKRKRPLHDEDIGGYYIESFFELFEAVLGILSNSVSFIRVGAFALNHVGLFIAFHTMAEIINNSVGDVTLFILGNAIVIGLEGLIVFIQGLRLIYYEMFSKYFEGEGVMFNSKSDFNKHREVL